MPAAIIITYNTQQRKQTQGLFCTPTYLCRIKIVLSNSKVTQVKQRRQTFTTMAL